MKILTKVITTIFLINLTLNGSDINATLQIIENQQKLVSKLSDDIGKMADRIVETEKLIVKSEEILTKSALKAKE